MLQMLGVFVKDAPKSTWIPSVNHVNYHVHDVILLYLRRKARNKKDGKLPLITY